MARKLTAVGRKGLVLVVAAIIGASFGASAANAARQDTASHGPLAGFWDGPG